MRQDGRWKGSCGGCGCSALPKSRFMRFSLGTDLNKQPGYWAQTLPVFWCGTAGPSIVDLCMPCTKAAWPICCEAVGEMILLGAGSRVSASDTSPVAASSATARSLSARTDQRPGRSRGPRTIGSQARSELATLLPLLAGSTLGQSSSAGARRSVHLLEPSRPGGHELASRASLTADGGGAQGMGWKSHGLSSPDAEHSGQLSANLPQPASPLIQNLLCSSQPKILDLAAPTR